MDSSRRKIRDSATTCPFCAHRHLPGEFCVYPDCDCEAVSQEANR